MRHLRENLLVQFSVVSFVAMAVIAVVLAIVLSNKIRSDAINDLVDEAVGSASGRLLSTITPADLEVPMTGARYDRFHEFVQQSIVSERTARVKIWAKDGTVIYSNDPAGVGEKFPAKENLLKALDGDTATEIKIPKDVENARERYLGTLMEVYTPIIFPGTTEPQGAFEIYQYYEPTEQRINELRGWVFGSIGGGFLILYGALVSIVGRGWRTINRQRGTLAYLAYHDALTDLPNRTLLKDRLTLALAQARRNEQMLAVMFLDLDQFKVVNDTAGHVEGDKLLQSVSQQLNSVLREGDTVARVGGDEFILLLPKIEQLADATEIAERVLTAVGRTRVIVGHEFNISTSIGITLFPTDGDDAETLLTNADIAMYQAKELGKNNFQFFTPAMNTRIQNRLALENDLRHGLERGEFVVYYQPQLNISTGQIVGVEALVRWQHPERGLVLPMEFIPVAEETGLIVPLGEWVLHAACAQIRSWQEAGLPPLRVAVNLSAREFQQGNMIETVAGVLEETGLAPKFLQLEITEGISIQDVDFTIKVLGELKEMGVQIAIDDFGTGYSALSYLSRFPIDVVKIDRSFVCDLTIDATDAEIATTIIVMAHNLGLEVIAEGVETEEQLAFLKQRRCDEMQGYLFSKPVPAEKLEEILVQGKRLQVPTLGLKSR